MEATEVEVGTLDIEGPEENVEGLLVGRCIGWTAATTAMAFSSGIKGDALESIGAGTSLTGAGPEGLVAGLDEALTAG